MPSGHDPANDNLSGVFAATYTDPGSDGLPRIAHGGDGEATRIVCGFLASEEGYNPLIAALPRVLTNLTPPPR